jgi:hypothetical protein
VRARSAKDATTNVPPSLPAGFGGDVTALSSASITIVSRDGTSSTYTINASTTVTDLRSTAALASLALGESVQIVPVSADKSVAASITIVPATIAGKVAVIDGDTITLAGPNGTSATIMVSSATTYSKANTSASLGDVRDGSFVFAEGTFGSSPTTIDAATVGIGSPAPAPGNGPGPGPGNGPRNGPGPSGAGPGAGAPLGPEPPLSSSVRRAVRR